MKPTKIHGTFIIRDKLVHWTIIRDIPASEQIYAYHIYRKENS